MYNIKKNESFIVRLLKPYIKNKYLVLMFLPVLLYFLIFRHGPIYGVLMAFQDFKLKLGIFGSEWIGFENFIDSSFPNYNVKPAMLICGNDMEAKKQASVLVEDLGFAAIDTGNLSQALHLEHMTLLWVKMVRMHGHNPNFVWAALEK